MFHDDFVLPQVKNYIKLMMTGDLVIMIFITVEVIN